MEKTVGRDGEGKEDGGEEGRDVRKMTGKGKRLSILSKMNQ